MKSSRIGGGSSRLFVWLLFLMVALLPLRPAGALNQRIYSLAELLRDSECVATGRVIAVDRVMQRAALLVEQPLKGSVPYRWMALNVATGGWSHPGGLMERLKPGVPLLFFAARVRGRHVVLGYQNSTWFQITAPDGKEPDRLPWTFTHTEIFLRRTYAGSTAELEQLLRAVIAGKQEPPPPNPIAAIGWGREVPADFVPAMPLPALPDFIARAIAEPKSGGVVRKIAVRKLTADEEKWVGERAAQFQREPAEVGMLLAQAGYATADAQRALEYERDYGRGGNRAWVRSAEEILDLRQRSDRLSWLDVRGVLQRAGELFLPVNDPVDLIHGLRVKFTWDELDPLLDDDKWGRRKLVDEIAKRAAVRSQRPLGPNEKLRDALYTVEFGAAGSGERAMESAGWKPLPGRDWDLPRRQFDWNGGDSGAQRPGVVKYTSSGSVTNPLTNRPPKPGIELAAKEGSYRGGALWFATGAGDYEGRSRGNPGAQALYDREWVQVRQGQTRSFLMVAQVYTPDHTDEVGEPRGGWFYIRRPSRYIDVGLRIVDAATRTLSFAPEQALLLKVEPALGRFDRVVLRIDAALEKPGGKNEVTLTAFADGVGEVARATLDLNRTRTGGIPALETGDAGIAFAPVLGTRTASEGYVPEFYLASLRLQQINEGSVNLLPGK